MRGRRRRRQARVALAEAAELLGGVRTQLAPVYVRAAVRRRRGGRRRGRRRGALRRALRRALRITTLVR